MCATRCRVSASRRPSGLHERAVGDRLFGVDPFAQELNGDLSPELLIVGEEYFAHPTPAEAVQDAVARRIGHVDGLYRSHQLASRLAGEKKSAGLLVCANSPTNPSGRLLALVDRLKELKRFRRRRLESVLLVGEVAKRTLDLVAPFLKVGQSVDDRSRAREPFAHRLGDLRGLAECVGDPLRRGELVGGSGISHQRPAIAYGLRKKVARSGTTDDQQKIAMCLTIST